MAPLLLALAASVAVVLGAPYVGQIRGAVQEAVPGQYRAIVAAIIGAALVAAVVAAVLRIRDRRPARYFSLAAAFAVGITYAYATRTGEADQDLVEQFHFIQYGLLTYLFYRVWRRRRDLGAVILPLCAGVVVGVADELLQWFVPTRVGEFHDVLINTVATACGLLFSVAVHPPVSLTVPSDSGGRRVLVAGSTVAVLAVAAFLDIVHLGYDIREPGVGSFRSRFSADALRAAWDERAARWKTNPPVTAGGLAREDQYLSEGQWHVRHRNDAIAADDAWSAWHENLILERFYSPVLDILGRWPPEQRSQVQASAGDSRSYVSAAEPYPIYVVNRWIFRTIVAALIGVIWILTYGRRPRAAQPALV